MARSLDLHAGVLRALALASLLVATTARADDCDFTDAAGGSWISVPLEHSYSTPLPRGRFLQGEAAVGTLAEGRTSGDSNAAGELAAKGQAGWHRGLQVCGSTHLVEGREKRGDSSFHVVFPHMMMAVSLGGEQQWQLRPALDASRIYLRRLYSATTMQVGTALAVWRSPDAGTAAVLPFRFDLRTQDQDTTGAVFRTWRVAAYESTHSDRRTEIVPISIEAMYPDGIGTDQAPLPPSSYLTRVDLATIQRRYGAVSLELSGGALFSSVDLPGVPVAAEVGIGWRSFSLRAGHTAHLAMDDVVTVEDRLAAGFHDGMWRAAAFIAATRTSADAKPALTGGGSAGMDLSLPEKVKLAVDVEVARSYYARLDGDPSPTPELAGIGTVRLERHFNVNPTAH